MVDDTLLQAMKGARARETARLEALFNVPDVRSLRLIVLRDMIAPELAGNAEAKSLFNLHVEDGDTPRLWLDLKSSIVMEPDPKTYQLLQLGEKTQEIMFETRDAELMKRQALRCIAHRLVVKTEKSLATHRQFTALELALVGLMGMMGGALLLGLWAWLAGFVQLA